MKEVPLTQWPNKEKSWSESHKLYAFSDMATINKPVAAPSDYGLSLKQVAMSLYSYNYQVVSTARNESNDGWLAVCITN
ncbi:hypothetical protein [Thalassotalea sp. PLHSN55]|uniref:hypothetical protein n=1 Tax=Thalassotalea sp. PLHSN55 TaxID=3435888 RepID=UPI003F872918